MQTTLSHFRLAGLAVSTGADTRDYIKDGLAHGISLAHLERVAKTIGLKERKVASPGVTALDLCEDATRRLLAAMDIDVSTIDAIIFVTQTPDHSQPNNACLLHGRLGLAKSSIAFDLSLGCSGWVYGLHQAGLLCAHGAVGRVLLCSGDTLSRLTHPQDSSMDPLFGDAGSAAIVERTGTHTPWYFVLGSDGKLSTTIKVPAGGARLPASSETRLESKDSNGNVHHAENLMMDGAEVFNFSLREVPAAINTVIKNAAWQLADVDALVLHQANKFIIENIATKCGLKSANVPSNLVEKYGNQSSASIPAALIEGLGEKLANRSQKIVGCGFGVGLSWAAFASEIGPVITCPIQPYPLK
jgi:3-oxoacyl-[acyl-carrier-protein] synthase-3